MVTDCAPLSGRAPSLPSMVTDTVAGAAPGLTMRTAGVSEESAPVLASGTSPCVAGSVISTPGITRSVAGAAPGVMTSVPAGVSPSRDSVTRVGTTEPPSASTDTAMRGSWLPFVSRAREEEPPAGTVISPLLGRLSRPMEP